MFFLKTVFGSATYPEGRGVYHHPCLEVIHELLAVVVLLLSVVLLLWLVLLLLLCLQQDLGQVVGQLGHPHACAAAEKCWSCAQACIASWLAAADCSAAPYFEESEKRVVVGWFAYG